MANLKKLESIIREHERRLTALEKKVGSKKKAKKLEGGSWYKPGSTIDKVLILRQEGFFNRGRSISELIAKLKTRDYHLQSSDLTLPLRKIVRNGLLNKTKDMPDGKISKVWLYQKS